MKKFKTDDIITRYDAYCKKIAFQTEIKLLRKQVKQGESIILTSELKNMKRVLRRLGYTNQDDIIETKGRVACEINAAHELIITELIFTGLFNELEVDQIASLLSVFVFDEKSDSNVKMLPELDIPYKKIQETARKIGKVMQESKIELDVDEMVAKLNPMMMEVTFQWAKGAKFAEICAITDVYEGSIIRVMRRLEELIRQLTSAAKAIGNAEMEFKFSSAINRIKRDIAFAASLYL